MPKTRCILDQLLFGAVVLVALLSACDDSPKLLTEQHCFYCAPYDGSPVSAPCYWAQSSGSTICCCHRIDGPTCGESLTCDTAPRTPRYALKSCLTWDGIECACTPEMTGPDCNSGPAQCENEYDASVTGDEWCRTRTHNTP